MAILTVPSDDELDALLGRVRPRREALCARASRPGTVNTSYALDLGAGRYFLRIYEEQGRRPAPRPRRGCSCTSRRPASRRRRRCRRGTARWCTSSPASRPRSFRGSTATCSACARSRPAAAHDVGAALARMHLAGPAAARRRPRSAAAASAPTISSRAAIASRKSTDPVARAQAEPLRDAVIRHRSQAPHAISRAASCTAISFATTSSGTTGKIAALLDFESAHRGPFAYDIAVTILSWSFRDAFDLDVARAIVAGYREVRELEAERARGALRRGGLRRAPVHDHAHHRRRHPRRQEVAALRRASRGASSSSDPRGCGRRSRCDEARRVRASRSLRSRRRRARVASRAALRRRRPTRAGRTAPPIPTSRIPPPSPRVLAPPDRALHVRAARRSYPSLAWMALQLVPSPEVAVGRVARRRTRAAPPSGDDTSGLRSALAAHAARVVVGHEPPRLALALLRRRSARAPQRLARAARGRSSTSAATSTA